MFVTYTDVVKPVSVMEGDSVTLKTAVTEVPSDDQIVWKFEPKGIQIAEISMHIINMFDCNVTFGHRLQLDSQTGSLTTRNIRTEHTGLYKLTSNKGMHKRFNVTVYGE